MIIEIEETENNYGFYCTRYPGGGAGNENKRI